MAVPAYTTDLKDIADLDITGGTALQPGSIYTVGRSPAEDAEDYPIQGTVHASLTVNATGKACVLVPGETVWSSGDYMFGWLIWLAPTALAARAAGGLSMFIGDSADVFNIYWVGGKDWGSYPYGGWQNFVVDPEATPSENAGAPSTFDHVGAAINGLVKVNKGDPLGFDVFRCGRGELRIAGGSVGDGYADFDAMAIENDNNANKWGLFQFILGSYLWKGLMSFGYGSLAEFTDANRNIVIDNTQAWVDADFNRIEVNNVSSKLNWTNISITALGTISRGEFEMIDNAEFNDTGGVFTDMSTFIYLSNATIVNKIFRRCGQVTQGGGIFTGCTFEESTAAKALVADDLTKVTNCDFASGGAGYAIEGFSAAASYTLVGLTFEGYASGDGSTGDEALHVLASSGTVTIVYTGAAPSVHSEGATIVKVGAAVDITVTVKTAAGVNVDDALVLLKASNDSGPFPFEETVNGIVNAGTLATVDHTGHGMASNDSVYIKGASLLANNGVFQITVNGVDEYEYTMGSAPGSSPTGTILATFVALYGLSSSGIVTTSREYGDIQPVVGWARKSTSTPFYKSGPLVGEVDDEDGFVATAILILDE